jgi:hypothetical protein
MAKQEWQVVQQADGSVTVTGLDATQVSKALEYRDYLLDYRKGYSKRKRSKIEAYRRELQRRGVDIGELEQDALKQLRQQK